MPGITNPAEEYFKDGSWAWDPIGKVWKKLILDPVSDRLVIDHPGDLEVVQPVPADLCVANHGWTGAAWKKLPMVWGYSELAGENLSDPDLSTGDNDILGTAVGAGELLIVRQLAVRYTGTVPTRIHVLPVGTPGGTVLLFQLAPVSTTWYLKNIHQILEVNDYMQATVIGATEDDRFDFSYSGYKMKIAE